MIDNGLLTEILDNAATTQDGKIDLSRISFHEARFGSHCNFRRAHFGDHVDLANAIFAQGANFKSCSFGHGVDFSSSEFEGSVDFSNSVFAGRALFGGSNLRAEAHFGGAHLGDGAVFWRTKFEGPANFGDARFGNEANFSEAEFSDIADFGAAVFGDTLLFSRANFGNLAKFGGARLGQNALFNRVHFNDEFRFNHPSIGKNIVFRDSLFSSEVIITGAAFAGSVTFTECTFSGETDFSGSNFSGDLSFDHVTWRSSVSWNTCLLERDMILVSCTLQEGATAANARFSGSASFTETMVRGRELNLDNIIFTRPIFLQLETERLVCRGTRFLGGGHISSTRDTYLVFDDASFPSPLVVSSSPDRPAELLAVRRADVAGLVISNVRLTRCRFQGAINLDCLEIQSAWTPFAKSPTRFGNRGRQSIAEEHEWWSLRDASRGGASSWYPESCRFPVEWLGRPTPLPAHEIADIYRRLRKGREDRKDEPGGADFYYGEMQMRLRSDVGSRVERLIIRFYWLVSGFGLRSSRAFAALAGVASIAILCMRLWGVPRGTSNPTGTAAVIVASLAVGDIPGDAVTSVGRLMEVALRLMEPALLGLALLAIRGRIKRG